MDWRSLIEAESFARQDRFKDAPRARLSQKVYVHRAAQQDRAVMVPDRGEREPAIYILSAPARGEIAIKQSTIDRTGGGAQGAGERAGGLIKDVRRIGRKLCIFGARNRGIPRQKQ